MRLSVRITREGNRFYARCLEAPRVSEGATRQEALDSLRQGLEEYYTQVRSIAPPDDRSVEPIDLVIVDEQEAPPA
jgi:predicted RNase H-like HicB family nuclease